MSTTTDAPLVKALFTLDGLARDTHLLTDSGRLLRAGLDAVAAAGGHVLGQASSVFPNGAVTHVLILAESHLSLHTWPEEDLIAIDLFSCGSIDGQRVLAELVARLGIDRTITHRLVRGLEAASGS